MTLYRLSIQVTAYVTADDPHDALSHVHRIRRDADVEGSATAVPVSASDEDGWREPVYNDPDGRSVGQVWSKK